jgi:all-trans-retinol 13,14-reductase
VEDHQVTSVVTKHGNTYHADHYISDVHPNVLLRLVDEKAFPKAYKNRINSMQDTCSFFVVFVKFKDRSFPYFNQVNYYYEGYDNAIDFEKTNPKNWPSGIIYLTPPVEHQDEYARTMLFIVTMDYEWMQPWENTHTGNRGDGYKEWKQAMMEKVLDRMEKVHPNFRDSIEGCFASSPLTIRDFYGNSGGSVYGFQKDCNDVMLSTLSVYTKVKNLFLTGQNVNFHGLCGVSLTAIQTAEAIVGQNTIIHKINKKAMQKE